MALCEVHLRSSAALQKMSSAMVIVPEGKPGPFPVLYLLHGLSDDHTVWVRRTSLERYVEELPLIVVMPDAGRSFYTDAQSLPKQAYETYLMRDLIGFVDATFQTIPTREGRVIAGLSMGGYGAFKLALKYPDRFCAAVSHSGALAFASRPFSDESEWAKEWIPVFGRDPRGSENDLFALARNLNQKHVPALRFDCGTEDGLLEDNRRFHQHLQSLGISHEYEEFPGGHNWAYWDEHIQQTLVFFARVLGLAS